jgi:hypothetical protein
VVFIISPNPVTFLKTRKGKTKPQLILFDDGNSYLVKFKNNPQGNRSLVNEHIVAKLGQLLHLPIPPSRLVYVPQYFIDQCSTLSSYGFVSGNQFASLLVENCVGLPSQPPYPEWSQFLNPDCIPAILIFDLWVSNADRWRNNILLQRFSEYRYFIYLIDHSDCFPGGTKWTLGSLEEPPKLRKLRSVHKWCLSLLNDQSPFETFLSKLVALPDIAIEEVLESIPIDWNISTIERKALFNHLINGRNNLPELINIVWKLKKE